jgi:predicted transcriptional regulator
MTTFNRILVLNMFIKHETLTLIDAIKKENLGMLPNEDYFLFLVEELAESGYVHKLDGTLQVTYTITAKGIAEGERLKQS